MACLNRWHRTESMGQHFRCGECPPVQDMAPDDLSAEVLVQEILYRLRVPQDVTMRTPVLADGRYASVAIETRSGQIFRLQVEEL